MLPVVLAGAAKEGRHCCRRWSPVLPRKGCVAAGGGRRCQGSPRLLPPVVIATAKEGRPCCHRWLPMLPRKVEVVVAGARRCCQGRPALLFAAFAGAVNKEWRRTKESLYRRLLRWRSWLTDGRHRDTSLDF
jgi:hypothetical protein